MLEATRAGGTTNTSVASVIISERGERPAAAEQALQTLECRPGGDHQDQGEADRGEEGPQHEHAADRQHGQHHEADGALDPVLAVHAIPGRPAHTVQPGGSWRDRRCCRGLRSGS